MVRIVLVIAQPGLRQLLKAMLSSKASLEEFDVRVSDSLGGAREHVAIVASAMILFDYQELTHTILSEVQHLRRAAPACILCAVSATRRFYHDEARSLRSAGVFAFLEEPTVTEGDQLIVALRRIAANLSGARVLAFLHSKLPGVTLGAAQITLTNVCDVTRRDVTLDTHARLRRVREQVG